MLVSPEKLSRGETVRRILAGMAAALLAAILLLPMECKAISASSYVLLDATTGRVLQQHNADKRKLIASTTKIMTALVVCERCNVLDRVRIPKEAVGIEGSSMYLKEGEILTVQELLYGLMLHSGNDAAVALAIYCGGTVEGFAQLMNDKAYLLGLENTHFVNPNGLDAPNHYSTAKDMARLSAYAMDNPIFAMTVSTKNVNVGSRVLKNHNKLLWQLDGADGIKTGYTKAAGRILVSSACRNGRRLICVTMDAPDDWNDHKNLLNSGFQDYTVQRVINSGQRIGSLEVVGGEKSTVALLAAEDLSVCLATGEQVDVVMPTKMFDFAPVVEGECAGNATVMLGESVIGYVKLVYGDTVEQESGISGSFWSKLFKGDAL